MTAIYKGEKMESMFSTRDPVYHKALKVPVAQLFSMTNMKNFEPYADECTNIFIQAMRDLEGQPIDLAAWLQWYAFDVIAYITFQRRFGFLEERRDVGGMISALDIALNYVKIIGQYPEWHPWLMGNRFMMAFIKKTLPSLPDPLASFVEVGTLVSIWNRFELTFARSQTKKSHATSRKRSRIRGGRTSWHNSGPKKRRMAGCRIRTSGTIFLTICGLNLQDTSSFTSPAAELCL
jgi:Cytochrome P450